MIFDGMRFTRSKKVVTLPQEMWAGNMKNYVTFGRICSKSTDGAIKTEWYWQGYSPFGDAAEGDKFPIYAVPVPIDGHSLTNMMYGADRYTYLYYNGKVYVKKSKSSHG